jgi:acetolactate synthase-1/2/3 large subunit
MTAAQLLVAQLQHNGVERIFCVPGESFLHILDALLDFPEIAVVTCRHEGAAAMMAEAYGKLTGKPGIAFVTRGPGATNASAGVHVAHQDSTPLILFIGHVECGAIGREAFQEIDYTSMFASFSKASLTLMDGARTAEIVNRAFALAAAGRPGPVVIALPEDVLEQSVDGGPAPLSPPQTSTPSPESLEAIGAEIAKATRPLLIVGGGGWSRQGWEDIARFAAAWDLPVVASFRRQDHVDNDLGNYVGNLGLGANPALAEAVAEADLIVALGTRLGEVTSNGYSLLAVPDPRQRLCHIHPDPAEIGRVYRADIGLVSGSAAAASGLNELAPPAERPWRERTATLRQAYLDWTTPPPIPGTLQLGEVLTQLRDSLPPDAVITNGAGNFAIWPNRYYRYRRYGTMLAPTSGSMGYGIPAAIAAKLQHPERTVIAFAGDGDFLMTGQELATAARYGAGIVVLLINNGMYGTIRMHQEQTFPGRESATALTNPDFVKLAESYGAFGARVRRTEEFAPAFAAALACGRAAVIELITDPDVISPTMTISKMRKAT